MPENSSEAVLIDDSHRKTTVNSKQSRPPAAGGCLVVGHVLAGVCIPGVRAVRAFVSNRRSSAHHGSTSPERLHCPFDPLFGICYSPSGNGTANRPWWDVVALFFMLAACVFPSRAR